MMNEAAGEMLEGDRQTRVSKRNCTPLNSCGVTLFLSVIVFFAVSISSRRATAEKNAPPAAKRLDDIATVRPLLKQYCYECHSEENVEAEIDFDVVAADSSAGKNVGIWLKVRGMLDNGQMPPKESPQLTSLENSKLRKWVHEFLMNEARAHAVDPGPVVLRRLTNDEYNYTVRDLTKVESLDPTREFPVDSAAGEGFTNSGSAQSMSPALVTKYMNAAKEVADHTVFLPSGIRFSRYTTRRDQTDELLARIQDFYRRFTQEGGGTSVNLQGIKFDTNQGGVLPYEKYLAATIEEREALTGNKTTIAEVAAKRSLNVRYLDTLWRAMTRDGTDSSAILINRFRQRWQSAKPGDVPTLVAEIAEAQKVLWKFNSIGHIGREGGAKSWLEPVTPITTQQEFRIPLPESPRGSDVILYLTANDLGDGNTADFVVWNRPRLEFKADSNGTTHRPILLRDMRSSAERVDEAIATEIPRTAKYLDAAKLIDINDPSGNPSAHFGEHPNGSSIDAASLCVKAPQILEVRIPATLAAGAELVVTGQLHSATGLEGSVQLQVLTDKPKELSLSPTLPVLVQAGSQKQRQVAAAMAEFRDLFPPSLCYARIVPVDEVVTLRLFYREDEHLRRLMLDDAQAAELDRLWDELFYVSREPLQLAVSFEQLAEFATQDRPDLVTAFEPLRKPINDRADAFRLRLQQTEPAHLLNVIELADLAWRRPLVSSEKVSLQGLYKRLRDSGLSHEEAIRLTWARVLTSPEFLYRRESPGPGKDATPVSGNELAIRLSYFLWSSLPDRKLRQIASSGKLIGDDVLLEQTRRMSKDSRTRRLAIQFACQWLHLRNFDQNDDKNEALYPKFSSLRTDMYEEVVRFFDDMFRNEGSILDILDANHTFVNKSLAEHYGMPGINGNKWKRVDDVRVSGRGGILGMAAFLASQSGASRTSPILRGNWVSETLLGERLPRPPANVPQLPETVPAGLTARQLIEHHTAVPECAKCHIRIDPYGFALEQYDAIGRLRTAVVDTRATLVDGKTIERIDGLRDYLAQDRRDDFVRQFCRKLLGYGLGREVQLSDEPLLEEMLDRLAKNDYRVSVAIETIVLSRQFREIRGRQEINDHQ